MAQALAVPPSNFWSGIDGAWSTFVLQVGTDPVAVNVLISTSEPVEYIIVPEGCSNSNNESCPDARGNLYDPTESSTWQMKGWYSTTVEQYLGYNNKGKYGFDTVALGYQGSGGPSLGNQIVAGIATEDFYMGLFGLLPKPLNFQNYDNPYPSYLQTLKDAREIPSLSWAYTAGARYRVNGVYASLTLGGFDQSRFEANTITMPMNEDITKYLSVNVQSISVAGTSTGGGDVIDDGGITMMLDSTLPYIWLPRDACDKIADAFSLDYDDDTQLYTIPDSVRNGLLSQTTTSTINFVLGRSLSGGDTVRISLPYQAFNLEAQPPFVPNTTNYFPLKRASNSSQYVLGRTFFQEAYVIADFERNNFSVSQARFETGVRASLTDIAPPGSPTPMPKPKSSNHTGAIVGAVVGVLVVIVIATLLAFYLLRRKKKRRQAAKATETSSSTRPDSAADSHEDHVPPYSPPAANTVELDSETKRRQELEATESQSGTPNHGYYSRSPEMSKRRDMQQMTERNRSPLSELEARQVHELPGSEEAGGATTGSAATAKPLHLRTVSRGDVKSPDGLPSATDVGPVPPGVPDAMSEIDLPGAFVQHSGRTFSRSKSGERVPMVPRLNNGGSAGDVSPPGSASLSPQVIGRSESGEISPVGSRTMSPALESKRTVSSDSVPIILDREERDEEAKGNKAEKVLGI